MINIVFWGMLLIYIAIAVAIINKIKSRIIKIIIAILFILPSIPTIQKHIIFREYCENIVHEKVFNTAYDVNSVIFEGSVNVRWMSYLAKTGGYSYVENRRRVGKKVFYSQYYKTGRGVRKRTSDTSNSLYQIENVRTMMDYSIVESKFVASNISTGEILGENKFLTLVPGALSRFIYLVLGVNVSGNYTCPKINSTVDMLDFFPEKVLIAKKQQ